MQFSIAFVGLASERARVWQQEAEHAEWNTDTSLSIGPYTDGMQGFK